VPITGCYEITAMAAFLDQIQADLVARLHPVAKAATARAPPTDPHTQPDADEAAGPGLSVPGLPTGRLAKLNRRPDAGCQWPARRTRDGDAAERGWQRGTYRWANDAIATVLATGRFPVPTTAWPPARSIVQLPTTAFKDPVNILASCDLYAERTCRISGFVPRVSQNRLATAAGLMDARTPQSSGVSSRADVLDDVVPAA
jgi:hypothetical protein